MLKLNVILKKWLVSKFSLTILLIMLGGVSLSNIALANITFTEELFRRIQTRYNNAAEQRIRDWHILLNSQKNTSVSDQLYEVNRFFNRVDFVDDKTHWGKDDYWATPIEFLATNAGDCEDFTIAKYFSLIELGVSADKLRLMYVTATRPRQAHMVLAYYESPKAIPLVLDNINKRILPATQRRDLIPIYSFNGGGLWHAKSQGQGRRLQSGNTNSLWIDLTQRVNQGF
jgi:predicted transglutaminase-like cysteine proteinase